MDSDPDYSHQIVVAVLDQSAILWTVDGIQQKKED